MKKQIAILLGILAVWILCLMGSQIFSFSIPLRTGYIHPISSWANFDGVHYLEIAKNGYTNNMRFMPMYPLAIALVSAIIPMVPLHLLGSILSVLFFIGSALYLIELLKLDYTHAQVRTALLLLIVLPTSFFFLSVYSESMFLFLTVASFYYARRKKWYIAAAFGFLSALTRIVGFLMVIPLLVEYFATHKKKHGWPLFALFLIPLGTLLYSAYNLVRWHNPLLFIQAHSQLSNGRSSTSLIFFPQTLYRYFKILITVSPSLWEWKIALLEVCTFILAMVGIYFLYKLKVRLSYITYVAISLLVPASSGTFTGLPRYILVLFPLLLVFMNIKNKYMLAFIFICSFILQMMLFLYFSRGYYVA